MLPPSIHTQGFDGWLNIYDLYNSEMLTVLYMFACCYDIILILYNAALSFWFIQQ